MTDSTERIEHLNKVEAEGQKWWEQCLKLITGVTHPNALSTPEGFNTRSVTKDILAKFVFQGIKLVYKQHIIIKEMRGEAQVLKSEMIKCQSAAIKLQQELITTKTDQAASIQSSVTTYSVSGNCGCQVIQ